MLFRSALARDELHTLRTGDLQMRKAIDVALYLRLTGKAVEDVFPSLKTTSVDA